MYCINCGTKLNGGKFCYSCGAPIQRDNNSQVFETVEKPLNTTNANTNVSTFSTLSNFKKINFNRKSIIVGTLAFFIILISVVFFVFRFNLSKIQDGIYYQDFNETTALKTCQYFFNSAAQKKYNEVDKLLRWNCEFGGVMYGKEKRKDFINALSQFYTLEKSYNLKIEPLYIKSSFNEQQGVVFSQDEAVLYFRLTVSKNKWNTAHDSEIDLVQKSLDSVNDMKITFKKFGEKWYISGINTGETVLY